MSQIDDELIRAAQMAAIRSLGLVANAKHVKNQFSRESVIGKEIKHISNVEGSVILQMLKIFKGKGGQKANESITKDIKKVNKLK